MSFLADKYRTTSIVTRWFILVSALCVLCTLTLTVLKVRPTVLSNYKTFRIHEDVSEGDSWKPMIGALIYVKKDKSVPVYDALFDRGLKFQYPLSSLLLFDLPQRITGASYIQIAYWLDFFSFFSVFIFGLTCAYLLTIVLKQKGFEKLNVSSFPEKAFLWFLIFVLTFLFYPILRSYKLGQIQTLLTLMTTLAILCWQKDKKVLTGVILGFICLIKPQLALLFFWGLIRRQWKMVIPGAIIVSIFLLISIKLYGLSNNFYYLHILSFLSRHGEAFYANQSINGLMNRLLFNGVNTQWDGAFPPYSPVIYVVSLISSLLIMVGGLLWNCQTKQSSVIDFCIMILCATIASPIAWEHHYGILLPIFIILSPFACYFYINKKWALAILAFGYLISSQYFEFTKLFADSSLNILQSYLFFGGCIVLFFLFRISWRVKQSKLKLADKQIQFAQ